MAIVALSIDENRKDEYSSKVDIEEFNELLTSTGLKNVPFDIIAAVELLGLQLSHEIMEKDISGYLEFKNGKWVIGVNLLHHTNRQRFTIAHEVAHYLLHKNQETQFIDQTFARRNDAPNPMEREADMFAATLLMPKIEVHEEISKGRTSLENLAGFFGVSMLAMKFRVRELGYAVK